MTRARGASLLLACSLLALCACGGRAQRSAREWIELADKAFAAGDGLARKFETSEREAGTAPATEVLAWREQAVASWYDASRSYRFAFRFLDPVAANPRDRALLAFRTGRALTKEALHGPDRALRERYAEEGLFWLGEAAALEPMPAVWFERATLHDSDIEAVHDPRRARDAYRSFLTALGAEGDEGRAAARAARARARVAALDVLLSDGEEEKPK